MGEKKKLVILGHAAHLGHGLKTGKSQNALDKFLDCVNLVMKS